MFCFIFLYFTSHICLLHICWTMHLCINMLDITCPYLYVNFPWHNEQWPYTVYMRCGLHLMKDSCVMCSILVHRLLYCIFFLKMHYMVTSLSLNRPLQPPLVFIHVSNQMHEHVHHIIFDSNLSTENSIKFLTMVHS